MNNIISELKQGVSAQLLSGMATGVGESEAGVSKALGALFPALLGGVLKKTTDANGAGVLGQLMGLLKDAPSLDGLTSQPQGLLENLSGTGQSSPIANQFIATFLGDQASGVSALIAKFSGIKESSSSSLLQVAAPLVLGLLGKKVSDGHLSSDDLASYLNTQKSNILAAAPIGLSSALGIAGDLNPLKSAAHDFEPIAPPQKSSSLKSILIAAALALIALFAWKSCSTPADTSKQAAPPIANEAAPTPAPTNQEATANPEANSNLAHLGQFLSVALPNGVNLNLPELGVENKLLAFINDESKAVDKTSWFSFDRLLFETNGSKLQASSSEQLNNIAQILKAYPNVNVKLGGYTDNTGSAETNLNLSQSRADTVKEQLLALAVPADRVEAKGYGEEHPIASNDTPEGRAHNRRIDILVTHK